MLGPKGNSGANIVLQWISLQSRRIIMWAVTRLHARTSGQQFIWPSASSWYCLWQWPWRWPINNWTSQNLDSYCILYPIHRPRQEGFGHFSLRAFVRAHREQCQGFSTLVIIMTIGNHSTAVDSITNSCFFSSMLNIGHTKCCKGNSKSNWRLTRKHRTTERALDFWR